MNHDTEMPVSILTFNRFFLWCGRRRVTMLFVVTPEKSLVEGETGSGRD